MADFYCAYIAPWLVNKLYIHYIGKTFTVGGEIFLVRENRESFLLEPFIVYSNTCTHSYGYASCSNGGVPACSLQEIIEQLCVMSFALKP